ncbi:MAG TPA: xanthine dehydrogenase [Bacteroidetes bacterium]|nr:xanthine dehydrogenase [Bacteroidota bacterium]
MDIWNELTQLEKGGVPAALVTVIRTQGSTPREVGAKMIITMDGKISGTIGGSAVEALVIEKAKEAILKGKVLRVEYNLDDVEKASTGMICGGKMEFFIEPLKRFPRLYIFGGGHVGLALADMAAVLGYPHIVIDDRPEYTTSDRFPHALERHTGSFADLASRIEYVQPAYVIIVTRCHDTDLEVMRGVLGKPYEYLGMICSRKKRAEVFKILEEEGFSKEELGRVHAPIGLDIGSKTPAEIAISIMAEVIAEFQKERTTGR